MKVKELIEILTSSLSEEDKELDIMMPNNKYPFTMIKGVTFVFAAPESKDVPIKWIELIPKSNY